jgi:type III secretion protein R
VNLSSSSLVLGLLLAGLLPFALMLLTSFVKMAVVLSLVRSALGTPQVPPSGVITGLALALSLCVMYPVATEVGARLQADWPALSAGPTEQSLAALARAAEPLEEFLRRHTRPEHLQRIQRLLGDDAGPSWRALVPAFVIGQLHDAFRLGFAVFLPFLVLDMLVANILLSLGMHMLSPTGVALPFKLLLFALADGWTLLAENLLGQFQGGGGPWS